MILHFDENTSNCEKRKNRLDLIFYTYRFKKKKNNKKCAGAPKMFFNTFFFP